MHAEPRSVRVEGPADLELVDTILDRLDSLWPDAPRATDEDRMLFTLAVSEIATNVMTPRVTDEPYTMISCGPSVALRTFLRVSSPREEP